MKRLQLFVKLTALCLILAFGVKAQEGAKPSSAAAGQSQPGAGKVAAAKYVPVHKYDPARDAAQDIRDALAEAGRAGKRVLLEVGGEWCIWCHLMDDFFEKHPELLSLREKSYVMLKVNFSEENKNEQALARYPPITAYPHIFVLDSDGKLLHSQDTGKLEEGKTYNLALFTAFLKDWAEKR
jgi:thiol:disulfide interchange protein